MKKLIHLAALSALLTMGSAFAADTSTQVAASWAKQSVEVTSTWFDEYYSCDAMVASVQDMLTQFGARDIDVNCTGGLPYDQNFFVHATFSAAVPAAAGTETLSYQHVQISGHDACGMHQGVFKQLLPSFTTRNVTGDGICGSPDDRYNIQFDVLK